MLEMEQALAVLAAHGFCAGDPCWQQCLLAEGLEPDEDHEAELELPTGMSLV